LHLPKAFSTNVIKVGKKKGFFFYSSLLVPKFGMLHE